MKVLFDHQIFSYQKYGGISKYFSELFKQYENNKDIDILLGMKTNVNHYLKECLLIKNSQHIENVEKSTLFNTYSVYKKNRNYCKKILDKNDFDILHSTFYDPYFMKYLNKKSVVTIHDMTPELYPQYFKGTLYSYMITRKWIRSKKEIVESADKIIAISENTRDDLFRLYCVPYEKIEVIYDGCNLLPEANSRLIDEPYILYVGLRDKYKNFTNFVKGVANILKTQKIKALCIGGGKFTEEESRLFRDLEVEKYFCQMYADDEELASAYKYALCFVYPSEYEGFGMPILESFSQKCPTILSNTSCFPEIGGDAALYFYPDNIAELEQKLLDVLSLNDADKQEMVAKGIKRLDKFSWKRCAEQTLDTYKKILNEA